ncbi:hypothetical protein D9611_003364 [Ephemerocybe angulata]|uniref:Ino eighty subunit 1 n=1 Tax=Ephemerocybe angulata TaxID=980116 RepID=A0A8H5C891_9AGAR|nr:hypothetical protein D9611_003364 [Tulosesus angulatus]
MASRRQSPAPSKRTLALKRADGEPLTRADIQYDVLHAIFEDKSLAFTDPYDTAEDAPRLCFRDLYIKAIMHSSKATKALKDKMAESPVYAEDFAMLSLLVNVGRINTTMSFFPEMKTAIRTYHPIPTLQRTNGNMQDAPRIKHVLKTGLLEREANNPPTTLDEVLSRAKEGHIPATSILNLLFVLSSHSQGVGTHFSERFEFHDIFLRTEISSASRARAFLWLCFNYLENPGSAADDYDEEEKPNPFADPAKDSAPFLISLSPEEAELENVDTPEEKEWAEKLISQRDTIVKQNAVKEAGRDVMKVAELADEPSVAGDAEPKKRKRASRATVDKPKRTKGSAEKSRTGALKKGAQGSQVSTQGSTPRDDMSVEDDNPRPHLPRLMGVPEQGESDSAFRILLGKDVEPRNGRAKANRYSPYPRSPEPAAPSKPRALRHAVPERTMLQHAWYIVNNTDPLVDSDDELGDEHDRHDYIQRLKVVTHLARQWSDPLPGLQRTLEYELSGN